MHLSMNQFVILVHSFPLIIYEPMILIRQFHKMIPVIFSAVFRLQRLIAVRCLLVLVVFEPLFWVQK